MARCPWPVARSGMQRPQFYPAGRPCGPRDPQRRPSGRPRAAAERSDRRRYQTRITPARINSDGAPYPDRALLP